MCTWIKHLVRQLAALAVCMALWSPELVRAQKTSVEHEAKAEFEAGVRASNAQDYAAAREHFLRSRQLLAKASTLLNLAITDLKLGLFDEALIALDAIDAPAPGPEQERLRQRARKMRGDIALLRESVVRARAEQQSDPSAAQAEPAAPSHQANGALAPAAAPPPPPATDTRLPSLTEAPPEEAALAPTASDERVPPSAQPPSLRGARTLLALGGALALGALGSSLWWHDRNLGHDKCLTGEKVVCEQEATIARERRAATALTIGLGVFSVGLIIGGAIWLVKRREARASISLTGDRRSLGLVARMRF